MFCNDWEPTKVGRSRASPEELERRRKKGLCFRCGKKGHMIAACPSPPLEEKVRTQKSQPLENGKESNSSGPERDDTTDSEKE